jgi:hypothetical protein
MPDLSVLSTVRRATSFRTSTGYGELITATHTVPMAARVLRCPRKGLQTVVCNVPRTNDVLRPWQTPATVVILALLAAACGSSDSGRSSAKRGTSQGAATQIDWKRMHYPIDCGEGVKLSVLDVEPLTPQRGRDRTAVLLQCSGRGGYWRRGAPAVCVEQESTQTHSDADPAG